MMNSPLQIVSSLNCEEGKFPESNARYAKQSLPGTQLKNVNSLMRKECQKLSVSRVDQQDSSVPLIIPSVDKYLDAVGGIAPVQISARSEGTNEATGSNATTTSLDVRDCNTYAQYRYMSSGLRDLQDALRKQLEDFSSEVHFPDAQDSSYELGRICLDYDATTLRTNAVTFERALNTADSDIESEDEDGDGKSPNNKQVYRLNFSQTPKYSIFPGQLVKVSGVELELGHLAVTDCQSDSKPPYAHLPLEYAEQLAEQQTAHGPLRVWLASGPFSSPSDLSFQPLESLVANLNKLTVPLDALVLQGPFVEETNQTVQKSETSSISGSSVEYLTFKGVWELMLDILTNCDYFKGIGRSTEIVFMPSTNDVIASPTYPQPPLDHELFELLEYNGIAYTTLPNPSTWVCGNLVWGSTTADICFHLARREVRVDPPPAIDEKKLTRYQLLAQHVLEQRSFYPLLPAGGEGLPGGFVPLEITQLDSIAFDVAPDILILPSRLGNQNVEIIKNKTVLINPGSVGVSKTFASIEIFPYPSSSLDKAVIVEDAKLQGGATSSYVPNDAPSRVRVKIMKLSS